MSEIKRNPFSDSGEGTFRRLGMMEVKRQLAERKCTYRFLVVEPLDPADRDKSSLAYLLATSLLHFS